MFYTCLLRSFNLLFTATGSLGLSFVEYYSGAFYMLSDLTKISLCLTTFTGSRPAPWPARLFFRVWPSPRLHVQLVVPSLTRRAADDLTLTFLKNQITSPKQRSCCVMPRAYVLRLATPNPLPSHNPEQLRIPQRCLNEHP